MAIRMGMELTQQTIATSAGSLPPPPPTSVPRAIRGRQQPRLAANAEVTNRRPRSATSRALTQRQQRRERKWVVMSDQAGYAIMQAKHLQLEARYNVLLQIPPKPSNMGRPCRQEWVIVGDDADSIQAAYEELDRIVSGIRGRPRAQ